VAGGRARCRDRAPRGPARHALAVEAARIGAQCVVTSKFPVRGRQLASQTSTIPAIHSAADATTLRCVCTALGLDRKGGSFLCLAVPAIRRSSLVVRLSGLTQTPLGVGYAPLGAD
jgi:hypothetical protein